MKEISDYIIENYNIESENGLKAEWVEPQILINKDRLDIIAKWIYIDGIEKHYDHGKYLYIEHIAAMTKNSFIEADSLEKNSIEKFIKSFNMLIKGIKKDGYDEKMRAVPVDREYRILDGGHRVAACLYYKKKIKIIKIPVTQKTKYDYRYFISNNLRKSLLDEMIFQYICLKEKIYVVNKWPIAKGHDDEVENLIDKYGDIFYIKKIVLNERGGINYIRQIYAGEVWTGSVDDRFKGCFRKLQPCFGKEKEVVLFFVEPHDNANFIELKEKIRNIYGIGKHSVHINDTKKEALVIARLTLNNNSLNYLNQCDFIKYKKNYRDLISFKEAMNEMDDYIITGSIVLSLYGIRFANDIDYLNIRDDDVNSHSKVLQYYPFSKNELFYDPELHYYTDEMKIVDLKVIREFKHRRAEKKDIEDVRLIDDFLNNIQYFHLQKLIKAIKLKERLITARIQGIIIRVSHKTGMYITLKRLYHLIKR